MTTVYQDLHLQPLARRWRAGSSPQRLDNLDPYTGESIGQLQLADEGDVDAAYAAAAEAQPAWAALPAERTAVMHTALAVLDARHDEIVEWLIRESGSTRNMAEIEWSSARAITEESATLPGRVDGRFPASNLGIGERRVRRRPLGVVGVISPWTLPLHLSQRSVAPALALGNAVVLKPASDTPITGGLLIAKIFEEAGLPAGLLSVVVGACSEIGDAFVQHPIPSMISFTGSTPMGWGIDRVAAGGDHLKRVALELDANSAYVVLADADLDEAVQGATAGTYLHQGQICTAINRVIVEEPIYESFLERFVSRVRALKYGDPSAIDTVVGPIINARQLQGLLAKIESARADGARVLVEGAPRGNVLPPHALADVRPDMELAREETFGPVVAILKARDKEHALKLANTGEVAPSGAVHSGDPQRGVAFARCIVTGKTRVNDHSADGEACAAFARERNAGLGRFNGEWAIEEFTTDHRITVQRAARACPC